MIELLFELRTLCQKVFADLSLESKDRGDLPAVRCFIGDLPGDQDTFHSSDFPLALVQLTSFEDAPPESKLSTLTCRIVVGVYNSEEDDADKCSPGYHDLMNALKRLRQQLLMHPVVGGRWRRTGTLSGGPFDERLYPYWFGDIVVQYDERQDTEELTAEEEIDIYGSAYGNDKTKDWDYSGR